MPEFFFIKLHAWGWKETHNSVAIVDKINYLDKIKSHLNDKRKFEKIELKYDGILSFTVSQENRIDDTLKKLVASNSLYEEIRKSLKPLKSRFGLIYRLCKVYKDIIDNFSPFRLFLSAANTPTYKLATFIVPTLTGSECKGLVWFCWWNIWTRFWFFLWKPRYWFSFY